MPLHKYIVFLEFEDCTLGGPQEDWLAKILENSTVGEALSTALGAEATLRLPSDAEIEAEAAATKLPATADLSAAKIINGKLACPHCDGQKFRYIEDIQNFRTVEGVDGYTINVDGSYQTGEGFDDGDNARLLCDKCCTELAIPDGFEVEFI